VRRGHSCPRPLRLKIQLRIRASLAQACRIMSMGERN